MNLKLKKEIISHIFNYFGVFNKHNTVSLLNKDYLLDKKIAFETDDKKYENNIWAVSSKIDNTIIKILIADTRENIPEFTIIFQMDKFPPYALRLSLDEEDFGSIYFHPENNKWVAASTSMQAKFLFGVENLSEILINWEKFNDYQDMYNLLLEFLNFYEQL